MKRRFLLALFLCFCTTGLYRAVAPAPAAAEEAVLTGRVVDADGKAVEGAMVFAYGSQDVRRSADFISTRTGSDGKYRIVLPAGRYWLVARSKQKEEYGPLMPGDKHSGEAVQMDIAANAAQKDFVVTDLKDARRLKTREREGPLRISGRIIDEKGAPVREAYAFASRREKTAGMPEYLSAWVNEAGQYTLYVPRGKYVIGAATVFPPGPGYSVRGEMDVDADAEGVDITMRSPDGK
jgi:carboxypeptidase family protein